MIVVGVLIAFQVDQWNDRRQDSAAERRQLQALQADFEVNESRLRSSVQRQRRTLDAIGVLIRIHEGRESAPTPDSAAALVVQANLFSRFENVSGAYDALVSSGDIGLVGSADLRAALASFASAAGDGYEDVGMADDVHVELLAYMSRFIPLWHVLPETYTENLGVDAVAEEVDFARLYGDREFLSLLTTAAILETNHLRYFERLLGRTEAISELIERDLASR